MAHQFTVDSSRIHRNRSPHLGYLRHAPRSSCQIQSIDQHALQSILQQRKSPYVGFMRHAPSARFSCHNSSGFRKAKEMKREHSRTNNIYDDGRKKPTDCRTSTATRGTLHVPTKGGNCKYYVTGRLPGGNPQHDASYSLYRWFEAAPSSGLLSKLVENTERSPNPTFDCYYPNQLEMLNKLACWFLFPIAFDENSPSEQHGTSLSLLEMKHGVASIILPFFSSLIKRIVCKEIQQADFSHSLGTIFESSDPLASSCHAQSRHHISISSLAKACHEADSERQEHQRQESHDLFQSISTIDSEEIKRHLEIESILKLPTITYQGGTSNKVTNAQTEDGTAEIKQQERDGPISTTSQQEGQNLEWSWITVPKDPSSSPDFASLEEAIANPNCAPQRQQQKERSKDDYCVICIEQFQDGDRLRVLPCNHRFHTTCIDKWLSGSFSHDECFTGICPTCKSSPLVKDGSVLGSCGSMSILDDDSMQSMNLDGEVPSWAFARLGSRIAN